MCACCCVANNRMMGSAVRSETPVNSFSARQDCFDASDNRFSDESGTMAEMGMKLGDKCGVLGSSSVARFGAAVPVFDDASASDVGTCLVGKSADNTLGGGSVSPISSLFAIAVSKSGGPRVFVSLAGGNSEPIGKCIGFCGLFAATDFDSVLPRSVDVGCA